jgi:cytochrome c553
MFQIMMQLVVFLRRFPRFLSSPASFAPFCLFAAVLGLGPAIGMAAEFSEADREAGRQLVAKHCAKCHGDDGLGVNEKYASLAGQPAEYLLKQLFNFKSEQRKSDKMLPVVNKISASQAVLLAEYFSRLPPSFTPSDDEAEKSAGRKLYFEGNPATGVSNCVACHGVYATGGGPVPRLVGQNPYYLETQLRRLIDKSRGNDRSMHYINAPLTKAEIRSLAIYLASAE